MLMPRLLPGFADERIRFRFREWKWLLGENIFGNFTLMKDLRAYALEVCLASHCVEDVADVDVLALQARYDNACQEPCS